MLDLALTFDGDLLLNSTTRDLETVTENDLRIQSAICRIQSIRSDWYIDHIGANLEEILGMPNTQLIRTYGITKIKTAITFDSFIKSDEVYIICTAQQNTLLEFKVYIKNLNEDTSTILFVKLDLVKGVNITIGW